MATATKAKSAPKKKVTDESESIDGELEAGAEGEVSAKPVKAKVPRKAAKSKAPPRSRLY